MILVTCASLCVLVRGFVMRKTVPKLWDVVEIDRHVNVFVMFEAIFAIVRHAHCSCVRRD